MDSIPLPLIDLPEAPPALEWARLPFAAGPSIRPLPGDAQRCRIETLSGATMNGEMVAFDTLRGELGVRTAAGAPVLALPMARFRRLTLTVPVALPKPAADAVLERALDDAQVRDYRVELAGGGFVDGHTIGHARHGAGWFLFAPTDVAGQVLRQFVPAAAALRVSFGATEDERARERWIVRTDELVEALHAQALQRPRPLGEALIELGLTRRGDVERVLSEQQGGDAAQALGQMLLERGLIDQQDLQIALAHKMGVPLVDVTRYPIDAGLIAALPRALLYECRAWPLLVDATRVVVAMHDLARVGRLANDPALAGRRVLATLARRPALELLLRRHLSPDARDPWAANLGR